MALLWFDGFELDRTATAIAFNYNNPANWPTTIPSSAGRFGGFSLKSIPSTVTSATTFSLPFTAPSNARQVYVGVAVKAGEPGNNVLWAMIGGFVALTAWSVNSVDNGDGTWTAELVDSDLGVLDSSPPILNGQWTYIEVGVLSQDAGAWSWRVNGEELGSGTSDFLPNGIPQAKLGLSWPSLVAGTVEYDDVYVTEDGFLGPEFTVEGLQVDGDASVAWARSGGATNYENVDDNGDSDGDATYVQTDTDGFTDLYSIEPLSWINGSVEAVRWQMDARNDTSDNRDVTPEFLVGGVSGLGGRILIIDQVYQRLSQILTTNPADATVWDRGDFGTLQIGMVKGTPVTPPPALQIYDEDNVLGYMETAEPDIWFELYDEDNVLGEMDTKVSISQLALFDETAIEGEFDLVVL